MPEPRPRRFSTPGFCTIVLALATIGMIPIISPSPKDLETFISTEVERWGKIVRQAGIAGTH